MNISWDWNIDIFWNWGMKFSRIGTSTFFGIGIATLVVGNPTCTSEEFEYFLLKKSNIVVDFFIIYK